MTSRKQSGSRPRSGPIVLILRPYLLEHRLVTVVTCCSCLVEQLEPLCSESLTIEQWKEWPVAPIGGPGSASLAAQYMLRPLKWFLMDSGVPEPSADHPT